MEKKWPTRLLGPLMFSRFPIVLLAWKGERQSVVARSGSSGVPPTS